VQQGPQLLQGVLQRRPGDQQPVVGLEVHHGLVEQGVVVLQPVSLVHADEGPVHVAQERLTEHRRVVTCTGNMRRQRRPRSRAGGGATDLVFQENLIRREEDVELQPLAVAVDPLVSPDLWKETQRNAKTVIHRRNRGGQRADLTLRNITLPLRSLEETHAPSCPLIKRI